MTDHPATAKLPVLIFGTHITALGVLRVLHSRGIETYVVDATQDIITRSRWYRPAERLLAETSDSDELASYLRSLTLPRAVLIACSDRWTSAVAGLPADVRERFPASVPPLEAVEQFVDKFQFRDLVEGLGIPHPDTIALGDLADLDRATAEELAAGFLKPTKSHLFHLEFGTKGFFVTSRQEAASLVEQASAAGITLMLQEWIPGGPSRSYLIDGFFDLHGNLITILARRRVRMDPPRIANTASYVTVPMAEVAEAPAMIRMLLEKVHYRGIFNVEVKFDVRDGRFKIIEVNPRPFWHIGLVERAGVDFSWMAYLDAQGLPVTAPAPYRIGRYGLYEICDAAAVLRAWGSFRRPNGPVLGPWLWGDHTLLWWGDLGPGAVDLRRAVRRRVGNALGRLRGAPR